MLVVQSLQLRIAAGRQPSQPRTCAALKRLIFHMMALRLASYFALPVLCWMSALAVCSGTCGIVVASVFNSSLLRVAGRSSTFKVHAPVPHAWAPGGTKLRTGIVMTVSMANTFSSKVLLTRS